MKDLVYKQESYAIIGICMEVHNSLGSGFSEIVYKDALEFEMSQAGIEYERKKNMQFIIKELYFHIDFMLIL
jgi:GxxExxY protein